MYAGWILSESAWWYHMYAEFDLQWRVAVAHPFFRFGGLERTRRYAASTDCTLRTVVSFMLDIRASINGR